jgi:uncharacterized membrane protein YdjX (TVP38/TMEM64 family)
MRLVSAIVILTSALGAVGLWASPAIGDQISTGFKVSAALVILVVVWIFAVWLRNRRRRRMMDLRDSALW